MRTRDPANRLPTVAAVLLLAVRGWLLWYLIPLAAVSCLFVGYALQRQGITFRQYLGWLDCNMVALIERTLLRPLVRNPFPWTPWRDLATVTHRVALTDPL